MTTVMNVIRQEETVNCDNFKPSGLIGKNSWQASQIVIDLRMDTRIWYTDEDPIFQSIYKNNRINLVIDRSTRLVARAFRG